MAFTLRPDPETDAALTELSQQEGRSKHDLTMIALTEMLERRARNARFDAILDRTRTRYATALERLGE